MAKQLHLASGAAAILCFAVALRQTAPVMVRITVVGFAITCALASVVVVRSQVTTVGVVAFRDESGANPQSDLSQRISGELQQTLNRTFEDTLLARALTVENQRTVEQLASLGKQDGIAVVVRGGVVAVSAGGVELYADVISVATGTAVTLRTEGQGATTETALSAAVEQLSRSIHDLITASASSVPPMTTPSGATQKPPAGDAGGDGQTSETDEELLQLIAQAEALLNSRSSISSDALEAVGQALEQLNAALALKAEAVAKRADSSSADREIARQEQELWFTLTEASEQAASGEQAGAVDQAPSAEKRNILASIAEYIGEVSNVLQQIQLLRGLVRGEQDDKAAASGLATGDTLLEESSEEVNGIVTDEGEPVEGATITDSETGETATTDSSGKYSLRVVGGRPSTLIVRNDGKQVTSALVQVQRGRGAIADFALTRPGSAALRQGLTVMPSTAFVRPGAARAAKVGGLSGIVRDGRGRPVSRALVTLAGVAAARTDSQGRYAFVGVPAGSHRITVHKPGSRSQSLSVQITERRVSQSTITLASDSVTGERSRRVLTSPAASTLLRGVVTDRDRRPLSGAKVTLMRQIGAVSVLTAANGSYVLRNVEPGEYRAIATKFGYSSEAETVALRRGETETRSFSLRKTATPTAADVLRERPARTPTSSRSSTTEPRNPTTRDKPATSPGGSRAVVRPAAGAVRGTVLDARTGRPIAGATVRFAGGREVRSDERGGYSVGNLGPGVVEVVVSRDGYEEGRERVSIRGGETATLTVRLSPRSTIQIRPKTPPPPTKKPRAVGVELHQACGMARPVFRFSLILGAPS